MIKINYPKKFDRNNYYKKLNKKENLFNQYKKEEKGDFHTIFKDISFKCLVIGKFDILKKIKEKIGISENIKNNEYIKDVFNYKSCQTSIIKPFFEDNLLISTCYYCNIDYINSYDKRYKTKNKFTLDHYFDKSTYPYLALSLYNIIPSCSSCNSKIKGTKKFDNIAPSSNKYDFDEKVKFKLSLDSSCENLHIKSKNDIDINLKENYSSDFKDFIKDMYLDERYKAHKDIVYEMIEKTELYPESRLKELQDLTGIPFQQIKKDIFNLSDEIDLSKKPFSKLIKDMSEELGLI